MYDASRNSRQCYSDALAAIRWRLLSARCAQAREFHDVLAQAVAEDELLMHETTMPRELLWATWKLEATS